MSMDDVFEFAESENVKLEDNESDETTVTLSTAASTDEKVLKTDYDALLTTESPWKKFQSKDFSHEVVTELMINGKAPEGFHHVIPDKGICHSDFSALTALEGGHYSAYESCSGVTPNALELFNKILLRPEMTVELAHDLEKLLALYRLTGTKSIPLLPKDSISVFHNYKTAMKDLSFFHPAKTITYTIEGAVEFGSSHGAKISVVVDKNGAVVPVCPEDMKDHAEKDKFLAQSMSIFPEFMTNSYIHARVATTGTLPSKASSPIDTDMLCSAARKQDEEIIRPHVKPEIYEMYAESREEILSAVKGTYNPDNAPKVPVVTDFPHQLNLIRSSVLNSIRGTKRSQVPMTFNQLAVFRDNRGKLGQEFKEFRTQGALLVKDEAHSVLAKWSAAFVQASLAKLDLSKAVAYGHSKANHWNPLLKTYKVGVAEGDLFAVEKDFPDAEGIISDVWVIPKASPSPTSTATEKTAGQYESGGEADIDVVGFKDLLIQVKAREVYRRWLDRKGFRYVLVKIHPIANNPGSSLEYDFLGDCTGFFLYPLGGGQSRSHNGERIILVANQKVEGIRGFKLTAKISEMVTKLWITEMYYANILRNTALFTGYPILHPDRRLDGTNKPFVGPCPPMFTLDPDLNKHIELKGVRAEGRGTLPKMSNVAQLTYTQRADNEAARKAKLKQKKEERKQLKKEMGTAVIDVAPADDPKSFADMFEF